MHGLSSFYAHLQFKNYKAIFKIQNLTLVLAATAVKWKVLGKAQFYSWSPGRLTKIKRPEVWEVGSVISSLPFP